MTFISNILCVSHSLLRYRSCLSDVIYVHCTPTMGRSPNSSNTPPNDSDSQVQIAPMELRIFQFLTQLKEIKRIKKDLEEAEKELAEAKNKSIDTPRTIASDNFSDMNSWLRTDT